MTDKKPTPEEIAEEVISGRYKLLPRSRAAAVAEAVIKRIEAEGYTIKDDKELDADAWPFFGGVHA